MPVSGRPDKGTDNETDQVGSRGTCVKVSNRPGLSKCIGRTDGVGVRLRHRGAEIRAKNAVLLGGYHGRSEQRASDSKRAGCSNGSVGGRERGHPCRTTQNKRETRLARGE